MSNMSRLLVIALLVPGCLGGQEDAGGDRSGSGGKADDDMMSADRTVDVSWRIEDIATGQEAGCQAGYDTIEMVSQPVDADGDPVGTPFVDLFDCASAEGTTAPLPSGLYRVWLEVENQNGSAQYAQSTSAYLDLTANDKAVTFSILRDGGYFSFSWNLVGATTNDVLECADVAGIDAIELIATLATSTSSTTDLYDCDDGYGVTAGIPAGKYTVSIDAMSASSSALGIAPPLTNRVIEPRNKVTGLGTISIPIDGM